MKAAFIIILLISSSFSAKRNMTLSAGKLNKEQIFILKKAAIKVNLQLQEVKMLTLERDSFKEHLSFEKRISTSVNDVRETESAFLSAAKSNNINHYHKLFFQSIYNRFDTALAHLSHSHIDTLNQELVKTMTFQYTAYLIVAEAGKSAFDVVIKSKPDASIEASALGHSPIKDNTTAAVTLPYGQWKIRATYKDTFLIAEFDASVRKKKIIQFDFEQKKVFSD